MRGGLACLKARSEIRRSRGQTGPASIASDGPLQAPAGDLIGYARVSTQEQILDLQLAALTKGGCVTIYQEKVSASGKQRRPQLDLAIKDLRPGDTLVVWRLDRLARSMDEFHARMKQIKEAGATFRSLTENFDFGTFMGEFVLTILAATAQLERQLTIHRTKAGLEVARAKGKQLGGMIKIGASKRAAIAADMKRGKLTNRQIATKHAIGLSSIYWLFPGGRKALKKGRAAPCS